MKVGPALGPAGGALQTAHPGGRPIADIEAARAAYAAAVDAGTTVTPPSPYMAQESTNAAGVTTRKSKVLAKPTLVNRLVNSMLELGVVSWLSEVRRDPAIVLLLTSSLGLPEPDLWGTTTKKGQPLVSVMKEAESHIIREMQLSGVESLLQHLPLDLLRTVLTDAGITGVSDASHKTLLLHAALLGRSLSPVAGDDPVRGAATSDASLSSSGQPRVTAGGAAAASQLKTPPRSPASKGAAPAPTAAPTSSSSARPIVPTTPETPTQRSRPPVAAFASAVDLAAAYRLNELRGFNKDKGIPGFGPKVELAQHALDWVRREIERGGDAAQAARVAAPGPTKARSGRRKRSLSVEGTPAPPSPPGPPASSSPSLPKSRALSPASDAHLPDIVVNDADAGLDSTTTPRSRKRKPRPSEAAQAARGEAKRGRVEQAERVASEVGDPETWREVVATELTGSVFAVAGAFASHTASEFAALIVQNGGRTVPPQVVLDMAAAMADEAPPSLVACLAGQVLGQAVQAETPGRLAAPTTAAAVTAAVAATRTLRRPSAAAVHATRTHTSDVVMAEAAPPLPTHALVGAEDPEVEPEPGSVSPAALRVAAERLGLIVLDEAFITQYV